MNEHTPTPPEFFRRLFRAYCNPRYLDRIEGDLLEVYAKRVQLTGKRRADVAFAMDVLMLFRPGIIRPMKYKKIITGALITNHLQVGWRSIVKAKAYSVINILGLSMGICASLAIITVARFEFSFDQFHADADRIFQVNTREQYTSDYPVTEIPAVLPDVPETLEDEIQGIETVAPFHIMFDSKVMIPGTSNAADNYTSTPLVTDSRYFKIMQYDWLAGNHVTALSRPYQVVLSERAAARYFGRATAVESIGRTLTYNDSITVTVTGVIKSWEGNTEFPYEEFISLSTATNRYLRGLLQLDQSKGVPHGSRALVKLERGTDFAAMNAMLSAWFTKKWPESVLRGITLQPITDIHFATNGNGTVTRNLTLKTLYILIGVACFIMMLAIINYINLATAQSIRREGEMGVRRVLGGTSFDLILQFLTESFLITSLAIVLALPLIQPLLSAFQNFTSTEIQFDPLRMDTLVSILIVAFATTLLAGWYPARVVASFRSGVSVKRAASVVGGTFLRKGLIVFQFGISLLFIIGSLVISSQLRYMLHDSLGFKSHAIAMVESDDRNLSSVKLLVERIKAIPGIVTAGRENMPPMGLDRAFFSIQYKAKSEVELPVLAVKADENYLSLYGLNLIAGRNLMPGDTIKEFVINESLSKDLGFANPQAAIGEVLFSWNRMCPIVGVVQDFHQASFRETIKPSVVASAPCYEIAFKMDNTKRLLSEILNDVEKEWKKIHPGEPFEYTFFEDSIAQLYEKEQLTLRIANASAAITVFISCIGLFGLAMFTTEKRTKEIGIRKVLGASTKSILAMLGKEILALVLLAIVIASIAGSFIMDNWLQGFAYHVSLNAWIFFSAGAIGITVASLAIGIQSLRAASRNPVKSLRSE